MATIKDVSELAGVSTATVSRVINQKGPVSEEMRALVLKAMQELNYSPNAAARSLATNRTNAVGVVVNCLSSQFYGEILQGIEEVVEAHGKHMVVTSGQKTAEQEKAAVEFLLSRSMDAYILNLEYLDDLEILAWRDQGRRLVLVNRHIEEMAECSVHLLNEEGGFMAVEHLLKNGHRRIAHISGRMAIGDARTRLHGYRRCLEQAGIEYDSALVVEGDFQESGGYLAAKRLLARGVEFSAVFVANDQMAAGAMVAFREAGLSMPEQISLVGFDDVLMAGYLYPGLTTISQPCPDMGRSAARIALGLIDESDSGDVQRVFKPKLVERQSVRNIA